MAGVVIDISTGKVIETLNKENKTNSSNSRNPVIEIVAPDGRRVFSINRASQNSRQYNSKQSFAA